MQPLPAEIALPLMILVKKGFGYRPGSIRDEIDAISLAVNVDVGGIDEVSARVCRRLDGGIGVVEVAVAHEQRASGGQVGIDASGTLVLEMAVVHINPCSLM